MHRIPAVALLWPIVAILLPGAVQAETPRLRDVIDSQLRDAWKRNKITPSGPSSDSEFLRRVTFDLTGSVPTYDETVAFLESKDPAKRDKLIENLLADPRYSRHQADIWDMILFGRNPPGYDTQRRDGFQTWLRSRFEKNIPYDIWVRELLRADGNSVESGALYFVQYSGLPQDAIEAVSQTFLGVQLQCARCHDHPYEEWKQLDFYGMAAFLARLQVVNIGKVGGQTAYAIGEHDSGDIQFTGPAKDAAPGKKGKPVSPRFLNGSALAESPPTSTGRPPRFKEGAMPARPKFSRKDKLAEWITTPANPYFARAITNRLWAQFFGRGLVHPVDNLSPSNEPSLPDLLAVLTREMVAHKFDLKWFIRELVSSKTYQLSIVGSGDPMPVWYQHARTRPLSAEELVEGWRIVTGYAAVEQVSSKLNSKQGSKQRNPSRYRPLDGYLLQFFGSPNTGTGDFQGGLREHLYMNNGPLTQMISAGKGSLAELVGDNKKPVADRVNRLFLQALQRKPTATEADKFAGFLEKGGSAADAVWALVSSNEFRFNH